MAHSSAMDISGTQLRAVRAALFTALVVTLSAASHVLLSRVPLPLTTVAAIATAVFVLAYALAGRERGYGRIAALLIPLELAADTVFTAGQHVCYGEAGGPVAGPLRSVGFDMLCGGTPVGTPLARMTADGHGGAAALLADADPGAAWLLLGAHVGVGLLAAAWLRRGERALAQLLRAVGSGDVPVRCSSRSPCGDRRAHTRTPPAAPRAPGARHAHAPAGALRGTAWTTALGCLRLSTTPPRSHPHGEEETMSKRNSQAAKSAARERIRLQQEAERKREKRRRAAIVASRSSASSRSRAASATP